MKRILLELRNEISSGRAGVLVTIVSRSGSAPRGVGTTMAVLQNGELVGTIGGGTLEYRARQHAMALSKDAPDGTVSYGIHLHHSEQADQASGFVTVLFRKFHAESDLRRIDEALRAIERDTETYLICPIENSIAGETRIVPAEELMDQLNLARLPEAPLLQAGNPDWLIEPLIDDPRVLLFGGGHVAQKTAAQMSFLDYRVWVVEEREEYATLSLFPAAERIVCASLETVKTLLRVCARDHAIVMTSAHELDYEILRWLLTTPADYIGCIGSKRKISLTKEKLLMDGASLSQMERVHAPIGLAIGAETPAEIAVSIAAELIEYLKKREIQ